MFANTGPPSADEAPLISNRFLFRLTATIAVLSALTVAISMAGRWYGQRMALGGHTESTELFTIRIGTDTLALAANAIRSPEQRHAGTSERVDLYLTWPGLQGYSAALKKHFNVTVAPGSLLFLQLSQSIMTTDMSGRLEPVYRDLFEGKPQAAPQGLTMHRLHADSDYGNEVIYTAPLAGQPNYVVRCLIPVERQQPTGGDCQRDIRIGNDLSVLYRFSSTILNDWHHIDAAITAFVMERLAGGIPKTGGKTS